jgi:hypothetical protein
LNRRHNETPTTSQDRCEPDGGNHVGEDGRQHDGVCSCGNSLIVWPKVDNQRHRDEDTRSSLGRLLAHPDSASSLGRQTVKGQDEKAPAAMSDRGKLGVEQPTPCDCDRLRDRIIAHSPARRQRLGEPCRPRRARHHTVSASSTHWLSRAPVQFRPIPAAGDCRGSEQRLLRRQPITATLLNCNVKMRWIRPNNDRRARVAFDLHRHATFA